MNNDLNQIAIFVKVAELQSFSKAADLLGIEKSTVSQKIAQLEKRLGTKLFHRTTRSVSLSESGQQYLACCEPALSLLSQGDALLEERNAIPSGKLRVSTPPQFVEFIMSSVITPYLNAYPDVELEVIQHMQSPDLVGERFDVAVVSKTGHLQDSSLIYRKIYETERCLAASKRFLEQHGRPKSLADLQAMPSIGTIDESGQLAVYSQLSDGEQRLRIKPRFAVNHAKAVKSAVAADLGFAAFPVRTIQAEVESGELEIITPKISLPSSAMYVIYSSRTGQPVNVRTFVDALVAWGESMKRL